MMGWAFGLFRSLYPSERTAFRWMAIADLFMALLAASDGVPVVGLFFWMVGAFTLVMLRATRDERSGRR